MSSYRLIIELSAERELGKLRYDTAKRVDDRIQKLPNNPRPPGCLKLAGSEIWRIRVGKIRVLYVIDDGLRMVYITKIDERSDVYRK